MGSSVITQVPQATKVTALLAKEIVEAIIKALEAHEKNAAIRAVLKDYKTTGEVDVRSCEGYIRDGLERALTEENIPYAFAQDEKTGVVFMISRMSDKAMVDEIASGFVHRNSNIVSEQQLRSSALGSKVYGFDTLNEIQEHVLQEQALRRNVLIGATKNNDLSTIIYDEKDREAMLVAGAKTAMLTTGVLGERTRHDLEAKTARLDNITIRSMNAANTNDSFYITSVYSPAIRAKITPEGMTVYHGDSVREIVDAHNPNYQNRVQDFAQSMSNPVVLSPSRVEGKTTEEVVMASRGEMDVTPVPASLREEIVREQDARFLIETKLSLNNGAGHKYVMDFLNGKMSFGDFFEWEMRNDEREDEKNIAKAKEIIAKYEKTPESSEKFRETVSDKLDEVGTFLNDEKEITPDMSLDDRSDDAAYDDIDDYNSGVTVDSHDDEIDIPSLF